MDPIRQRDRSAAPRPPWSRHRCGRRQPDRLLGPSL